MIVYFDPSALVKAYLEEVSSNDVRALMRSLEPGESSMSIVGYAEVRAALAAAERSGRIDREAYASAVSAFEDTWREVRLVLPEEPLVRLAGDLAEEHALRGFDAIHLASAMTLHRELDEPIAFCAFDDRLVAAAVACGLDAA